MYFGGIAETSGPRDWRAEAGEDVTKISKTKLAQSSSHQPVGMIFWRAVSGWQKGAQVTEAATQTPSVRLGKGQKRTKKKEAVVTGILQHCPILPHPAGSRGGPAAGPGRPEPPLRPTLSVRHCGPRWRGRQRP